MEGREAKESEAKEGCAPGLEPAAMRAKRPTDRAGPHPQQPQPGPEPPSELAAAQGAERDAAFSTRPARRFEWWQSASHVVVVLHAVPFASADDVLVHFERSSALVGSYSNAFAMHLRLYAPIALADDRVKVNLQKDTRLKVKLTLGVAPSKATDEVVDGAASASLFTSASSPIAITVPSRHVSPSSPSQSKARSQPESHSKAKANEESDAQLYDVTLLLPKADQAIVWPSLERAAEPPTLLHDQPPPPPPPPLSGFCGAGGTEGECGCGSEPEPEPKPNWRNAVDWVRWSASRVPPPRTYPPSHAHPRPHPRPRPRPCHRLHPRPRPHPRPHPRPRPRPRPHPRPG